MIPTWELVAVGTCGATSKKGGWAYLIQQVDRVTGSKTSRMEDYGPSQDYTNESRMELGAIKGGLLALPKGSVVQIFTSSSYAQGALSHWFRRWEAEGWRKQDGSIVQNRSLIISILDIMNRHQSVHINLLDKGSTEDMRRVSELAGRGQLAFDQDIAPALAMESLR